MLRPSNSLRSHQRKPSWPKSHEACPFFSNIFEGSCICPTSLLSKSRHLPQALQYPNRKLRRPARLSIRISRGKRTVGGPAPASASAPIAQRQIVASTLVLSRDGGPARGNTNLAAVKAVGCGAPSAACRQRPTLSSQSVRTSSRYQRPSNGPETATCIKF